MTTGICGVILAAGESSRMGRDKALLRWPKVSPASQGISGALAGTLLSAAFRAFAPHCDLVLVVAGKNAEMLKRAIYAESAFLVCNPEPERGQFSSLRTGLREVLERGRDRAMITLVDRPPPRPETLCALVDAFSRRDHGTWAIIPEYQGQHGHPIIVGREMIEAFLEAPPGSNAREVEHENVQKMVYLPVSDRLTIANLDTPDHYFSLQSPP